MTREEAKRRIEICRDFLANNYSDMGEPNFTAFNMAIQALSQEPCDDAISREAVIEWLENATYEDISYAVGTELSFLPSVTQKSETVTEFADRCRECGAKYGKLLEQIRAEIDDIEEGISSYHNDRPWVFKDEVLQIIDKYR